MENVVFLCYGSGDTPKHQGYLHFFRSQGYLLERKNKYYRFYKVTYQRNNVTYRFFENRYCCDFE